VLFLYRPRETWMPYRLPRRPTEQDAYNRDLQRTFDSTTPTNAAAAPVVTEPRDLIGTLRELAALHDSGALTDDEFTAAKAKLLGITADAT
jgi:hypothetical protein